MGSKVLSNIEPFNDVYYIDCFFNSVFPVMRHFNRSNYPILSNDIFVFDYQRKDGDLYPCINTIPVKSLEGCLVDLDVQSDNKYKDFDLLQSTLHAIDKNRPVVVWVDCHDISTRKDAYKKMHLAHTLLVYGYDEANREINIIEHKHHENLFYKPMRLSFEDYINGNNGYITHYHYGQFPTYHAFYVDSPQTYNMLDDEKTRDQYRCILRENITAHMHEMIKGMACLSEFLSDYRTIVLDETIFKKRLNPIISQLNKIINFRTMERYRMEKICGQELEGVKLLNDMIEQWNTLRLILFKLSVYGVLKSNALQSTIERLERAEYFENKYIEYMNHGFIT